MSALAAQAAPDQACVIGGLSPAGYRPHALHSLDRDWPETNCYVDLWIEVLASLGLAPEAALGFTAAQDFEGDQFTFFKYPLDDLAAAYAIEVSELALYDNLQNHIVEQVTHGRLVLVEVDAFHLPDTRGVSYGLEHSKTTIAVNAIDPARHWCAYFHNGGYFALDADDYRGVFEAHGLFPYAEFARIGRPPSGDGRAQARERLRHHTNRAPTRNPIVRYATRLAAESPALIERGPLFFHKYAFNTVRQVGANFELLGAHLRWLDAGAFALAIEAAQRISSGAKAVQFRLARATARRRPDPCTDLLASLADAYDATFSTLRAVLAR